MKVILFESRKHFTKDNPSQEAIADYIKSHKLYYEGIGIPSLIKQIRDQLKKWNQQNNEVKKKLQQLSLYLNNDKNKFMFEIYEIVLKNPKGITYKDIDKKVSIGIVSVSHYCCRLKKMNFVGLRHEKNEKVVYPKKESGQKKLQEEDEERSIKQTSSKGFHFFELSAMDNIWINISSWQAKQKNGITNEDIKQKLHKSSETKLIMKMVDQAFQIYDFDKQMVSEGKVFENRFKNITNEISQISSIDINRLMVQQNSNNQIPNNSLLYQNEQKLNPLILNWLQQKFPNHPSEKFLFHLINEEMRDYISACGVKSAKRTCTPIKLTRYIKILNSLNDYWPQTHLDLKNYIIEEEKSIQNGTMHKRSILGILDCLVSKQIIKKKDHEVQYFTTKNGQVQAQRSTKVQVYYYPLWPASGAENLITKKEDNYQHFSQKNKKKHKHTFTSLNSENKKFEKITVRQHQVELSTDLIYEILKDLYISRLKKGFKRIMYSKRSKQPIRNYEPDLHLLHFLQNENYKQLPIIRSNSYSSFVNQLDRFVDSEGTKQQQIDVNYEVIKMFRKSWRLSEIELRLKFGNSWYQRIEPLVKSNIIYSTLQGNWVLQTQNRFFV